MDRTGVARAALVVGLGVVLCMFFWWDLWSGRSLIGGDIYPYFYPQKSFWADQLRAGNFPFWCPLVGHGYPILGESQTGIFYPPHLALYPFLDVRVAYNACQMLHYILAFAFCALYCRSIRIGYAGAILAALIYTYGWFPNRICLEWAIIGGAWLPLALWCVERFVTTHHRKFLFLLSVVLAVQLLPGHYNIAFITQLTVLAYAAGRLYWAKQDDESERPGSSSRLAIGLVVAATATGFVLAAVQLVPTWELKQRSQRKGHTAEHDPLYGFIPTKYLGQVVLPWSYYQKTPECNPDNMHGIEGASTNSVEAHLYFGIAPLVVILLLLIKARDVDDRRIWLWAILGLLALIYAMGWTMPITRHIPGFSFFKGAGRYSIITTLAVAILAGRAIDSFRDWFGGMQLTVALIVIGLTVFDLQSFSRATSTAVSDAESRALPAIDYRESSEIRAELNRQGGHVRLLAPGANMPTILGLSMTPVYLGIGPREYYDEATAMPVGEDLIGQFPAPGQVEWLRKAGITHILSQAPIDEAAWECRNIWFGTDNFMNRAWVMRETLFLFELRNPGQRLVWSESDDAIWKATIEESSADRVVAKVSSNTAGELTLTDLQFPGWEVTVDGAPAENKTADGMFRAVDVPAGEHTVVWTYRPWSFRVGAIISAVSMLLLITFMVFEWRRSQAEAGDDSPNPVAA